MNSCACGCGQFVNGTWAKGHNRRKYFGQVCLVDGCDRPAIESDRCHAHAEYLRRTGTDGAGPAKLPPGERFAQKYEVRADSDCWWWTGSTDGAGRYGSFWCGTEKRVVRAHRWSYEHHVGPIPDGLVLDHLCRNTRCVNPDHLQPVPQHINILRGQSIQSKNARKTHCKRGHEFTPENTRIMSSGGRACITCEKTVHSARDRQRRYRARKKAEGRSD